MSAVLLVILRIYYFTQVFFVNQIFEAGFSKKQKNRSVGYNPQIDMTFLIFVWYLYR